MKVEFFESGLFRNAVAAIGAFVAIQGSALAQRIDLQKAMELGESASSQLKISEANAAETSSKSSQTLAMMAPTVTLESTQAWISDDVNKLVGKTVGSTTVPDRINTAALVATQPIVLLGPLYMKYKIEKTSADIAKVEANQGVITARYAAAEAYIRAVKALQFLEVAKSSLAVAQKQRQDGEILYRTGKLTQADLFRLDLAVSDASAQQAQAESAASVTRFALATAVAIDDPLTMEISLPQDSLFQNHVASFATDAEVWEKTLQNRSEIKAAESRIDMSEYAKIASDFDYFPMINAFAKYERDFEKEDLVVTNPINRRVLASYKKEDIRDSFSYGLQLKWTIWDWGSRIARSNELSATTEKARYGKKAITDGLHIESKQAFYDLQYAKSALESAKASMKFAQEAYRQQELRFKNGSTTITELIAAERDLMRIRTGLVNAQGDLDLAWIRIYKVMGITPQLNQNKSL